MVNNDSAFVKRVFGNSSKEKQEQQPPAPPKPKKINSRYPDKWRKHSKINGIIENTRFIAFKTPLAEHFFVNKIPKEAFYVADVVRKVKSLNKTLGLVIDLTDTDRYYDPAEWTAHGVEYVKLPYSGHGIQTHPTLMQDFKKIVDDFFKLNTDPGTLIGVHCTHGVNRTGYLICRYLIECQNWTADAAMTSFREGRGEPILRDAYIEHLRVVERGEMERPPRVPNKRSRSRRASAKKRKLREQKIQEEITGVGQQENGETEEAPVQNTENGTEPEVSNFEESVNKLEELNLENSVNAGAGDSVDVHPSNNLDSREDTVRVQDEENVGDGIGIGVIPAVVTTVLSAVPDPAPPPGTDNEIVALEKIENHVDNDNDDGFLNDTQNPEITTEDNTDTDDSPPSPISDKIQFNDPVEAVEPPVTVQPLSKFDEVILNTEITPVDEEQLQDQNLDVEQPEDGLDPNEIDELASTKEEEEFQSIESSSFSDVEDAIPSIQKLQTYIQRAVDAFNASENAKIITGSAIGVIIAYTVFKFCYAH